MWCARYAFGTSAGPTQLQFSLKHEGADLVVEFDQALTFWNRARLIVDDEVVDERHILNGTTVLRSPRPTALKVEVSVKFGGRKKAALRDEKSSMTIPLTKDR